MVQTKRKGVYYIGRVIKLGVLTTEGLIQALLEPTPIIVRQMAWTFIDTKEYNKGQKDHFVYGRLSKYSPEAEVSIVLPEQRQEIRQQEPNLSIASSPFVYIPEHSGIAFMQISNHISYQIFIKRFCDLVKTVHRYFFVDCVIDMIADLHTFAMKLGRLDGIYRISARVSPPNPLFGPLWKSLKLYLESRKTDKMKIEEESDGDRPIKTDLPKHVQEIADLKEGQDYKPKEIPMGDAAILMAADGYGSGLVEGKHGKETIVIRTSETIMNFTFLKEPEPEELYRITLRIFEKIRKERHMEHQ
jgi:hypothetical protein